MKKSHSDMKHEIMKSFGGTLQVGGYKIGSQQKVA